MTATTPAVPRTAAHASSSAVAPNYHPLPVVIAEGVGTWLTDTGGRRYLDCLAGYSALNFGHAHPVLLDAARRQLDRVTLTSRAFLHDQLEEFCAELAHLATRANPAMDTVLPMNTGAEAVETAIKLSRKWGYDVKGVPDGEATIVVAAGNFHGRTTTIVSFSTDESARAGFGPFTPGFRVVPYGDAAALEAAVDDTTVAVLLEPVQGEAGVVIPPAGYLPAVRAVCDARGVLLVADEIQSGLGRTGTTFATEAGGVEPAGVRPDVLVLGKALGGGIVPVSAVVSRHDVLGVMTAGSHGSTFGGNPLACAVGRAVVGLLETGEYQERARLLGARLRAGLEALRGRGVTDVRTIGLWAGVDVDPALGTGRALCEEMSARGVLAKDTHGSTIRLAPPLVIDEADLDLALGVLGDSLDALAARR
ncbi:ornithine--oxo-acid transaminase [Kineosporia sp. A_224]|uniref:ornithine--oxo-acid transaminase n=1 Tax=Kineosporia sp. A_224 TaxID=1962180 RepID=UPI000B4ADE2A|nr:ornithine--oxo-acid transaminase [Kineosporia sp. A_224]